jgi:uncharacterized membrane protein
MNLRIQKEIKVFENKKVLFVLIIIGIFVFLTAAFSIKFGLCPDYSFSPCMEFSNQIAEIFLPSFVTGLFYLIVFRMSDAVYRPWSIFTYCWFPISMFLILIAPEYSSDWMLPIASKGGAVIVTSVLFIFISTIIIAVKLISIQRE